MNKNQGDASKLLDLAAAKVEFRTSTISTPRSAASGAPPRCVVVSCEDRFVTPMSSGYRDVQMVLRMRNGHLAEFRLHLAALDAVAEWEHVLL